MNTPRNHKTIAAAVDCWGTNGAVSSSDYPQTAELAIEVDGQRFDAVVEDGLMPSGGRSSGDSGSAGGATRSGGVDAAVATAGAITAEMQGTVFSIQVEPGNGVSKGDLICVLEAMKVENDVVASSSETVASIPDGKRFSGNA